MPRMGAPIENLEGLVQTGQKKFVSYKEAMALYSLGRHTIEELAEKAHGNLHVYAIFFTYFLKNIWHIIVKGMAVPNK